MFSGAHPRPCRKMRLSSELAWTLLLLQPLLSTGKTEKHSQETTIRAFFGTRKRVRFACHDSTKRISQV